MKQKTQQSDVLLAIDTLLTEGRDGASSSEIHARTGGSYATVGRLLDQLVKQNAIFRRGKARATRYFPQPSANYLNEPDQPSSYEKSSASPNWSPRARTVLEQLARPLGAREPVTYQRAFVDDYVPNESSLLPHDIADALMREGRMQFQQPAGTYARKVLEQLLIDLSWSSSRLEGNTYSRLATEKLFKSGAPPRDSEGLMLLNHKRAIEFLVDAVPSFGLNESIIRNLHALLMQDLLAEPAGLGAIRTTIVNITATTYVPLQVPQQLKEILALIVDKAQLVKSPVEAAFFLWVNLAYLQPFADGNKRTSRLAANIPLLLYNCAPLAFLDVNPHDYVQAMLGVYELLDLTIAIELFSWTYRRSIRKYNVILQAMGAPEQFRVQHRELLSDAVRSIVREGRRFADVIGALGMPQKDADAFAVMLEEELKTLSQYNCARHRLTVGEVQAWIARGRPR